MKRKTRGRQIDRVFTAVKTGCRTSTEVSDLTGLPVKHCSAYLWKLGKMGKIRRVGAVYFQRDTEEIKERSSWTWEPIAA